MISVNSVVAFDHLCQCDRQVSSLAPPFLVPHLITHVWYAVLISVNGIIAHVFAW